MNFEERFERSKELCKKFDSNDTYILLENMCMFNQREDLKKLTFLLVAYIGCAFEDDKEVMSILEKHATPWMLETLWQLGVIPDSKLLEIAAKDMEFDEIDKLFDRLLNLKFGEFSKEKIFRKIYDSPYKEYLALHINETASLDDYMDLLKIFDVSINNHLGIAMLRNLLIHSKACKDGSEDKKRAMEKIDSLLYYHTEASKNDD